MACLAVKRFLEVDPMYSQGCPSPSKRPKFEDKSSKVPLSQQPSPFGALVSHLMTPDKMAANLKGEAERLSSKKLQNCTSQQDLDLFNEYRTVNVINNNNENIATLPSGGLKASDNDKPLFTFSQVGLICQRMLKEQEQKIREEYDKVLSDKLAEQYDTFVKFTHDQIQKDFKSGNPPSYLS